MKARICCALIVLSLAVLCIKAERPVHCLEPHPTGYGLCEKLIVGYYYNPEAKRCEKWSEGGCDIKGGHSYRTEEDCANDCLTE